MARNMRLEYAGAMSGAQSGVEDRCGDQRATACIGQAFGNRPNIKRTSENRGRPSDPTGEIEGDAAK